MLAKIRKFVNAKTVITTFKNYIVPKLEYGNIPYGLTERWDEQIKKIANNWLRICFPTRKSNVSIPNVNFHISANRLPLHRRREVHLLQLMYTSLLHLHLGSLVPIFPFD